MLIVEKFPVNFSELVGLLVGFTSEHDAINLLQVLMGLSQCFDATVNDNFQIGKLLIHLIYPGIIQGRNFTVLFRAQAIENCDAGMQDKTGTSGIGNGADKIQQGFV